MEGFRPREENLVRIKFGSNVSFIIFIILFFELINNNCGSFHRDRRCSCKWNLGQLQVCSNALCEVRNSLDMIYSNFSNIQ